MSDVTSVGAELIKTWINSREQVDQALETLSRRQKDAREAEVALAKWLAPEDAKPGEKIAVWFGDSLIQVEVGGVVSGDGPVREQSSTRVNIRLRGKHFSEIR